MLEKLPEAVGQALRGRRAGLDQILFNRTDLRQGVGQLTLSSPAFADHAPIPARYTADAAGKAVSPPLAWAGVPPGTESLALVVEDADSPTSEPLVHAIAVDIGVDRKELAEGELNDDRDGPGLNVGRNSYLRRSWLPPDPPTGHGVHRYAFQLFALGPGASFTSAPGRAELTTAIRERAIASGCLIGTYERTTRIRADEPRRAQQRLPEPPSPQMAPRPGEQPIGAAVPPLSPDPEVA